MIRFVTFAALAAFAATPVSAAEIRISLAGKSAAQLDAEVAGAARKLCMRQTAGETLLVGAYSRCVRATLKTAQENLAAVQSAD